MGREIEEETVSPVSKSILSTVPKSILSPVSVTPSLPARFAAAAVPGPIKTPHEIRAEAIRDLLGTAQHLNRQAAALRRIGYEVRLVSGPDMEAVAVSLCPAGVDRG